MGGHLEADEGGSKASDKGIVVLCADGELAAEGPVLSVVSGVVDLDGCVDGVASGNYEAD